MENTVKLFYEDAFMAEFDATVLSCDMEIPDILMKSGLQIQKRKME